MSQHYGVYWGGLLMAWLALSLVSLWTGSSSLPVMHAAWQAWHGEPSTFAMIFLEIRLPRTLIAGVAGATLGLCGAAMQGLLRNPLASPDLIGSSGGAALGAVIALYFALDFPVAVSLPFGGILGALLATALVYGLARRDARIHTVILAGLAVNALTAALISLLLNLAPNPYAMHEMVHWMLGSVANRSLADLWIMLPGSLLGGMLLMRTGRGLDALSLGEDSARSLGIDLRSLQRWMLLALGLALGSTIAITGTIGFVGLIVPHLLRPWASHLPSRLLPLSALGGAVLVLAADLLVRVLPAGSEIRLGVVTSLIGAPFFLHLLLQRQRAGS